MTAMLELRDLSFGYGGALLEGVNLRVECGDRAALVGPNGVGKTTLLRLICGALEAARGEVVVEGRSLKGMPQRERAKLVAMVPQNFEVPFDFTVEQLVEQGRSPHLRMFRGLTPFDRSAVERAMEQADVTGLRHRVFNELSGGERQRVKIALGLAQEAKLLLLDEPAQNLDIGRQAELMSLLQQLGEQGLTILASVHELHLVSANFNRVHLLSEEGLVSGAPEEVLVPERIGRAFRCDVSRQPVLLDSISRIAYSQNS